MANPPKVAYRTLKVHTGAGGASAAAPTSARARFAELLRRRPPPAPPPAVPAPRPQAIEPTFDDTEAPDAVAAEQTLAPLAEELVVETDAVWAGATLADEPQAPDAAHAVDNHPGADHAIAQYLARTVVDFCNDHAVRSTDGWQVSMQLRSELLNATTLHLSLSPHWLLLRFDTRDERARALVLQHQTSLQTMLDEALAPRRDVAITFD